ncbi:thioesterase [Streptomyces diacarni]|uniref:Thioesterase n=1 Tax=Streptomyces diacarni TaxID=2800381 RepID=A0A367FG51_9ACTN|nr:alpha/beta fold hydrolase [Streptomyces diacarni]RCG28782.1 thioesterase [Streptomyces diacarni]
MTGNTRHGGAWLRRFHPAPDAGVRLVCFPHAGGSATFYLPVSRMLSPSIEVVPVQYPGRQERRGEPCVSDIGELADRVVEELLSLNTKPLALFGHSMGAVVAYEVARRLESKEIKPLRLFVSGRRAPSRTRGGRVRQRDDNGLIDELKKLSGTDSQILDDPDMLRMILPAVRSDYKAVESYRHTPGPRLDCPVVALTGDDDPQVTLDEATAWSEHTVGGFALKVYEGGHFYLNSHTAAVLEVISAGIAEPSMTGPPASDR